MHLGDDVELGKGMLGMLGEVFYLTYLKGR